MNLGGPWAEWSQTNGGIISVVVFSLFSSGFRGQVLFLDVMAGGRLSGCRGMHEFRSECLRAAPDSDWLGLLFVADFQYGGSLLPLLLL